MFTVEAPQISAPPAAALRERAVGSTGLAYLQIDRSGEIRDWNPAAQKIFGWTRDEAVGERLTELIIPPALRSAHSAGFARYLVSGESDMLGCPVEVPGVHRDGSELRLSMTIDSLGEDGFFAFITDQTDGHRAQQELQRSNTLISAILQHTTAMISAKDLGGRYLFVNGEYERVFQVTAADMVGRTEADLLSAPVAALGRTHDQEVAETGTAKTVLEEIPFGDEIRQYVVTRVPLTDPDGSVYGVCTIGIDDTGRQRNEATIADGERRFWNTVNNAPGMLYQFRMEPTGETSFTFVSDGCRDIYQIEPDEVLANGGNVLQTIAVEDLETYTASVMRSAETLEPWDWRGSVVRRDGTRRWLYGAARPHREPGGATVWDGMLLDRTRERHTELDLEAVRGDLADLVSRLAVLDVTVPAGDGPVPALSALVTETDQGELAGMWKSAAAGDRVDAVLADGLLVRLRPRGDQSIGVSCFRLDGCA
ncbi:PAS domain-containing protein [Actinoplanes couchii]|uniref:PAS domain-containing protein n=1 Tax=Actinoplanes couchii TaxID=403638 RepID=UPI001943A1F5|nr:PAS domain S-box protein [Actinoplanes couchii]MDR6316242.1 PAS domain S-box-containing protein [Actinoplanes couchii]